jgi:DNA-binding response OmpR family regulator
VRYKVRTMEPQVTGVEHDSRSILLIDDDVQLCALLSKFFSAHGFRIDAVHDGGSGLAKAQQHPHDLVLLDIMLPVLDGLEVLAHLRKRTTVPVIMLTARSADDDRIAGLEAGADDYILKPFNPNELLARVRAVLRRSHRVSIATHTAVLEAGEFRLNSQTREAWKNGSPLELTLSEFDIFEVLMKSGGRPVSRDELAVVLYGREFTPLERSIDVHISNLRKKLEGNNRTLIRSVRGVGYVFVPAEVRVS